jgi:TrmH RNA methyltransferase
VSIRPRGQNDSEHKVAGKNACLALFHKRREDIRRVYVTEENVKVFSECLKWCAQQRIAYHIKTTADLDAVGETVHHDGVMFMARVKKAASLDVLEARMQRERGRVIVVLLDDVKNPHNLGAILRVCAHFGTAAVLAAGETPALSPAVMRTAEGGAEHVDVIPVGDGIDALERMRAAGLTIVGTSSHTAEALDNARLPARALVMFGSEGTGLSRRLLALADISVAIPGSGALESLNVACASSVILWELWRPRRDSARAQPRETPRALPARSLAPPPEPATPRASNRTSSGTRPPTSGRPPRGKRRSPRH